MKYRYIQISTLALIYGIIFTGFSAASEVKDFAEFDRAFIPPLAITQAEKAKPAKKAMALLMPAWQRLNEKYAALYKMFGDFDKVAAK